jgi:GTP cyclohydrolase I
VGLSKIPPRGDVQPPPAGRALTTQIAQPINDLAASVAVVMEALHVCLRAWRNRTEGGDVGDARRLSRMRKRAEFMERSNRGGLAFVLDGRVACHGAGAASVSRGPDLRA